MLSDCLRATGATGRRGEAILLLTPPVVRAPRVVALGLGPRPGFGAGALEEAACDAARRLAGLRVATAGLALPPEAVLGLAARDAVRAALRGVARALAQDRIDLALRLLVAPEARRDARAGVEDLAAEGGAVALRLLREAAPGGADGGWLPPERGGGEAAGARRPPLPSAP
jgi:hypothetical protein